MVDFYDFFKQNCPKVYAYRAFLNLSLGFESIPDEFTTLARDDATDLPNKVVYTCPSGVPWYRVTFC